MIIMIPHLATDIVHAKIEMTTDITPPDAIAVIETTTMSAIGTITAIDMNVPLGGRGVHASVVSVVEVDPGLGE
jgi:hypothetical protein